jgi:NAD dependent epimerase/dehydratase family enzyme
MDHPELTGVSNCTAPFPIKNAELMHIIRKTYGMPLGLPAPKWLLEIGSVVIGTETELILKSRWVLPQRLLDSGFKFEYATADAAVKDILK